MNEAQELAIKNYFCKVLRNVIKSDMKNMDNKVVENKIRNLAEDFYEFLEDNDL